jgi:FkbM family methyltransferase
MTPNVTLTGIKLIVLQTWTALRRYGPKAALFFLSANLRRKSNSTRQAIHRLALKSVQHPLCLREGRSDPFFFGQIFLDQEFAPVRGIDVSSVVDLGANIGLASVWFLNTFPRAKVVTIEANPDNYPLLEANLRPYGDRAVVLKGGVWWRRTPLALIRRQNEGDAGVREALPGDADLMEGWDLPALMERGGFARIDLLKIDIEGAEIDLLLKGADRWLPQVRNLTIELHGPECEAALDHALAPYTYQRQVLGELTFCFHLRPKQVP